MLGHDSAHSTHTHTLTHTKTTYQCAHVHAPTYVQLPVTHTHTHTHTHTQTNIQHAHIGKGYASWTGGAATLWDQPLPSMNRGRSSNSSFGSRHVVCASMCVRSVSVCTLRSVSVCVADPNFVSTRDRAVSLVAKAHPFFHPGTRDSSGSRCIVCVNQYVYVCC